MEHKWPILFGEISGVEQVWSEGRDDAGRDGLEIVREIKLSLAESVTQRKSRLEYNYWYMIDRCDL